MANPKTAEQLLAEYQATSHTSKSKKPQAKRVRAFCLTTYIDPIALDSFLRSAKWLQHFCYTTHDQDINEDGSAKEVHTHVLLYTYDGKTSSSVKKLFDRFSMEHYGADKMQNTLCQDCNDMVSQYRYQLHLDDPQKAQYSPESRVVDDNFYWDKLERTDGMTSTANVGLTILTDLMNGVPTYDLCQRYGKEFIYHISHYQKAMHQINYENHAHTINSFDPLQLFRAMLDTSSFTDEQKQTFYVIFAWLNNEAKYCYKSQINYYLDEMENNK